MATVKTSSSATTGIVPGVERNNYDYIQAYAKTQSTNPIIVAELVQAYILISQNLGLSGYAFIKQVESQGTTQQQLIYLAAQLNSVRPRNALIGVAPVFNTPTFVAREITA